MSVAQLRLDGGLDVLDRWVRREGPSVQRYYELNMRLRPAGDVLLVRRWGRLPGNGHARSRRLRYASPALAWPDVQRERERRTRRGYVLLT